MKRMVRTLSVVARTAIAVAVLYYLGSSGMLEWSAPWALTTQWVSTLGALALMMAGMWATSLRLSILLGAQGMHLPVLASLRLTLIGSFFNLCLPGGGGGDAVRIYYALAGNSGKRMEVATVMLLDRAVGMFGLLVFPLAVLPFFPGAVASAPVLYALLLAGATIAGVMLLGFVLSLSSNVRNSRLMEWLLEKLPLGGHVRRIVDTIHAYRRQRRALLKAFAVTVLSHSTAVAATILIARAINPAAFDWRMSLVVPLGFIANTIPITPGGLGVGEAAFNRLFRAAGLAGGGEILLGWRLLLVLVSLPGLALYLQGKRRYVDATLHEAQATDAQESRGVVAVGSTVPNPEGAL